MATLGLKPLVAIQIVIVLALLTLAGVSLYAIQTLSNAAIDMGQGKDVVVDILPPPLYVVEAQLVSHELLLTVSAERAPLLEKLRTLKNDFDQRNQYWEASTLDSQLKRLLLGKQRRQADLFWREVTARFIPAIQAGDMAAAQAVLLEMQGYYAAHRQAVDVTVRVANQYAGDTQNILSRTAQSTKWLVAIVTSLSCLGVVGLAIPTLNRLYRDLRESEERFRAIIDTEPECVKMIGPDGKLKFMNQAGLNMIEADNLNQVQGHSVVEMVTPEYQEAFRNLTKRVLQGESGTLEFEVVGLKGTRRFLETHAASLRESDGEQFSLLGITRDITERKKMQDQLHQQLAELTRWQEVMLGREDRVQELKQEINELLVRLGQPIRYPSQAAS